MVLSHFLLTQGHKQASGMPEQMARGRPCGAVFGAGRGSAAALTYEQVFVPARFGQWVSTVADAGRIEAGQRVLDLGCGTGILARELVRRVGPSCQVVGVDPHPGMLEVAQRLCPAIELRQGVGERLPLADRTFDAVVSQLALMFFKGRPLALSEASRVLAPGGRFAFAVWDSLERIKAYRDEAALLDRLAGQQAADALRAPLLLGDRNAITACGAQP